MCILFLYVPKNPQANEYKVILAVNRDEMYKRPTKEAMFWGTEPDIVGGRDMEPGREGGTWLAMAKSGRIGALLNVLQSKQEKDTKNRKGRGNLVNDYIKSSEDALDYMNNIFQVAPQYNPFSLITVDVLNRDVPQICYYSCCKNNKPMELSAGKIYGVGNSFIENPFIKVKTGKEEFTEVIQENNNILKREQLIQGILKLLKKEEKFYPDPQIIKQGEGLPEIFTRGLSSRFIKLGGYGTRTHTIILIDTDNKVYYKELTLVDPDTTVNNPIWKESVFEFKLNDSDEN